MTEPFAWYRYQQGDRVYYDLKKWDDCQPLYTKDVLLQLIKELRPAIKPLESMGKGKTTQEWFDILVKNIEEMKK
jgi:hypothetical protein